jgi:ubiquinone/menaquinone biosynthesis C-methylase UbiE
MGIRDRLLAGAARQLGHPSGLRGRIIARGLNGTNRELVRAAVDASGVGLGQVAADVGFGGGVGLRALLAAVGDEGRVHGIDISTTMVDRARSAFATEARNGRLELSLGSLVDLPLADRSVDAVITCNTVSFLDDVTPAFDELARVLRPSGRLVVGISDPDEMAAIPVTAHGFRLRPVPELLGAMTSAGLREVRSESLRSGPATRHLLIGEI